MKTIVCLSGTLCNKYLWLEQEEHFAKDYHFIYPSISTHTHIEDLAKSILKDLPNQFILMGFSAGVVVSLEILRQANHKVEKMILLAGRADKGDEALSKNLSQSLETMKNIGIERFFEEVLLPKSLGKKAIENNYLKDSIKKMAHQVGLDNFENQIKMLNTRRDSLDMLSQFHIPILLLSGENDQICPSIHQQKIKENAQNSKLITFPKTGHYISLESPKELNKVILNFL